ncbi:unnamed protein product [Vitrella brassicaformis CCMP3155]|uniref:Peptidase S1 domain-containing protein n=2 Tax=Vitrella brassicaformis TaxID=1169539 RepID=A0A0G4GTJ7_VITBC|nr:unnamed protein product [Vitrella brassicaformis CCMP3155]|eukprot:CEM34086.1 unnamed protein product [Vitrella brassicaformis CCMP3155]
MWAFLSYCCRLLALLLLSAAVGECGKWNPATKIDVEHMCNCQTFSTRKWVMERDDWPEGTAGWLLSKDKRVCGSDLNTYAGPCLALCQGTSIRYRGSCPTTDPKAHSISEKRDFSAPSHVAMGGLDRVTPEHVNRFKKSGYVYVGRMKAVPITKTAMPKPYLDHDLIVKNGKTNVTFPAPKDDRPYKFVRLLANGDTFVMKHPLTEQEIDAKLEKAGILRGTTANAKTRRAGKGGRSIRDNKEDQQMSEKPGVFGPPLQPKCMFCCGEDDRQLVDDTRSFPSSATGYFDVGCTCQMISENAAISAAHCVTGDFGVMQFGKAVMGMDTMHHREPFGEADIEFAMVDVAWFNDASVATSGGMDFSVLKLKNYEGQQTGFYGIADPENCKSGSFNTDLGGYPADMQNYPTQYVHKGCALPGNCNELYPSTLCDAYPGNSGSAHLTSGDHVVRGILSSGNCAYNYSCNIGGRNARSVLYLRYEIGEGDD